MNKVFPLQDMHVGAPNGGIVLRAHVGWNPTHPFVLAHPHLFTEAEVDPKDAELEALRAELAELKAKKSTGKAAG